MLVTAKEMLNRAKEGGYAVCAPNISSYHEATAVIAAAEENNSPVLIDIGWVGDGVTNTPEQLVELVRPVVDLARITNVPVVIQHDHGAKYEDAVCCIRAGMTAVMADRSTLPLEENAASVARVVEVAHACGVSVEAELGHVGHGSKYEVDGVTNLTDPSEAARFVELSGCDALAVAVGTAHGPYKGTPHIDFELLEEIKKVVDIPLVLHGGSSTGDERLERAARSGITKINIATDLAQSGIRSINAYLKDKPFGGPGKNVIAWYLDGYKEKLVHYMHIFGSVDKAWTK